MNGVTDISLGERECAWCHTKIRKGDTELLIDGLGWVHPTCETIARGTKGLTAASTSYGKDPGVKLDKDKPRTDLVSLSFVLDVARVLAFGARKYRPGNWRKLRHGRERYRAAIVRHLEAMQRGELLDPETGLPHVAHVGCCAMFIHGYDALGIPELPVPCDLESCEWCYPRREVDGGKT